MGVKTKAIESLDSLRQMCQLSALSGHEEDMVRYMKSETSRFLAVVRVDRLGNVIGCRPGRLPDRPKVMIFAHMDELGLMVRKVEPEGFVRLTRVGGMPEKSLPTQRHPIRALLPKEGYLVLAE
jgi:putative aminopeptidase FrvX